VAKATQPHFEVVESYISPTVVRLFGTVVVGKAWPTLSKLDPHVIERAIPLSLIRNVSFWKLEGVPERFVVMLVISTARAVTSMESQLSVFIVGAALEVVVVTRGVIRIFEAPVDWNCATCDPLIASPTTFDETR
jgi:hypothetical protein